MSRTSCLSKTSWLVLGMMLGTTPAVLMAQQGPSPSPSPTPAPAPTAAPAPAPAPAVPPAADDGDAIIVRGIRPPGSVIGDIEPEETLNPEDIEALGVGNVSDLIDALIEQIGATDGPAPVTLLNGKRISGRQEINDIPSEAIARTEILPAEVALSYGYPADQKVINIVLVPTFKALTNTVNYSMATRGGRESPGATTSLQTINGDNRLNITFNARQSAKLLESQRNITTIPTTPQFALDGNIYAAPGTGSTEIDPALSALVGMPVTVAAVPAAAADGAPGLASFQPGANLPAISDVGDFRTLSGQSRQYSGNITYSRALGGVSTTINAQLQRNQTLSLQGLPSVTLRIPTGSPFSPFGRDVLLDRYIDTVDPLSQRGTTTTGRLGVTFFGQIAGTWAWDFTGAYDYSNNRTTTNRGLDPTALQAAITGRDPSVNPFGTINAALLTQRPFDTGNTVSNSVEGNLLINGSPFSMPAGPVRFAGTVGYSSNDQHSSSLRSGMTTLAGYHRNTLTGRASLNVPLASRRQGFLGFIGELSANANYTAQNVSDFGGRSSYGYGLTWTPIPAIQLRGSMAHTLTPPTPTQLNGQLVVTPNVAVFDYQTGNTVFVTRLSGANPDLEAATSQRLMLSATIRPVKGRDWTLNANFTHNRTSNVVQNFPSQSPAIEAAFPDRFVRDADGDLISIDTRPTNFAQAETAQLRWGINLAFFLGKAPPPPPPRATGGRGGGTGGFRGGARFAQPAAAAAPAAPAGMAPATDQNGTATAPTDDAIVVEGNRPPAQQVAGGRGGGGFPGGRPPGAGLGGRGGFAAAGGRGGGGAGGRGGGGRGGAAGGRPQIRFELYHTWRFTDTVLIRPGLPIIDNLAGGAINGKGQPRNMIQANVSLNYRGFGGRLESTWDQATTTNGALGGASTLRFGAQETVNLSAFANFGQMTKLLAKLPVLKNTRLNLSLMNLFDTHQKVTDATGATPIQYEADRINPIGRTIAISLRKQF